MGKRVTLANLAEQAQVSLATVHRALNGKPGVSREIREEILELAQRMQYQPNQAAASLKRKTVHIAAVFPEPEGDNCYYYGDIWKGIEKFQRESYDRPVAIDCHTYKGGFENIVPVLEELEKNCVGLDGLLTTAHGGSAAVQCLRRLEQADVKVVLVGDDNMETERFFSVVANYEMIGSMAAELLCKMTPADTPFVVVEGDKDIASHRRTGIGFERYLCSYQPSRRVEKIQGYRNIEEVSGEIRRQIQANPQEKLGIYCVTARNTLGVCGMIKQYYLRERVCVVGNDLFHECVQYIDEGILTASLYKYPSRQAYNALQLLMEYFLSYKKPACGTVMVSGDIILRSNLEHYTRMIHEFEMK